MTTNELILTAMKAAAWERAKGALRELVAIRGSAQSTESERPYPFERTSEAVEAFIVQIEDEGLHE